METSSSSSWMKCKYHKHTHWFPIEIPKSSSSASVKCRRGRYNSPGVAAFAPKQTSIHHLFSSSKDKESRAWAIKSNTNKDADANTEELDNSRKQRRRRRRMITGAASIGVVAMIVMGHGHDNKAWALGPEGPMVEEFWENVRRYALYALTVSTGVLYAVLQPIFELLKNPISAVLIIIIFAATFFIFSQVLSAMFGVSDFAYQYAY